MAYYWIPQMSEELRDQFVAYLRQLSTEPKTLHFTKLRIEMIHIPLLQNGDDGSPEIDLEKISYHLGSNPKKIRLELLRHLTEFGHERAKLRRQSS